MRYYLLLASLFVTGLLAGIAQFAPLAGLKVKHVEEEQFTLDIFENSPTFSQALAVNSTGQIIGFREMVTGCIVIIQVLRSFATGEIIR